MSDRNRGATPPGDDLDIRITPVDDEFAEAPARPAARRVEVRRPRPAPAAAPRRPEPSPAAEPDEEAPAAPAERSVARLYFEAALVTLAICVFGVTFLVQPVSVGSGSMLNAILAGDHLLVNRVIFGGTTPVAPLGQRPVRRGDVIVFKHPTEPQNLYVKRAVGLPGETIEIYGTRVYIDGKELPETKVLARDTAPDGAIEPVGEPLAAEGSSYTVYYSQLRDLGGAGDGEFSSLVSADRGTVGVGRPFRIPEGHYFVLGDNRDNSEDSRFWGTVPRENVVGRAMLVYWSAEPASAGGGLGRIRWSRIGTLVQ